MHKADVVVVGAGPAGSTTALLLARQGLDVLLLDQAGFPRDKPCGEYLNPAAVAILERLGLLEGVQAARARQVIGAYLTSPTGRAVRALFPPWPEGVAAQGLSLPRLALDAALLGAAEQAGVRVRQGFRVEEVLREGSRVAGVTGRTGSGEERVHARWVVAADGTCSVVARRLGLAQPARPPRRVGLVAHYEGVEGDDWVEMHAGRRGYCGLGYSAEGGANVAMVAEPADLPRLQGRPEAFFEERLNEFPAVARKLHGAWRVSRLLVTGSMSSRATRVAMPGALLIGDASGFYDPFTGEGISYALRAAELAAAAVGAAADGAAPAEALALRAYTRRRRREFAPRLAVSRIIQAVLARPSLLEAVFRCFEAEPELACRLIGVTGGILPPHTVLSPAYVIALLMSHRTDRTALRHRLSPGQPTPDAQS